jgi:hypothetical protein
MLNNDTYETQLMVEMKIEHFHEAADQLRMASLLKKEGSLKHSKAVKFILQETGKALISSGNRLLKIA